MDNSTLKKIADMIYKQNAKVKPMSEQEVIEQMDSMIAHARDMLKGTLVPETWMKDIAALKIGKAATMKQIGLIPPVKMNAKSLVFIDYEDGHGECKEKTEDIYCCPSCLQKLTKLMVIADTNVPSHRPRYCEKCGQKIDWSREGIGSK